MPQSTEPTLQQEIASLGEDDLMETLNLSARQTGVAGTICISTAMGHRGSRVKYFEKPGERELSFSVSISSQPELLSNSLPELVCSRMAPSVIIWVRQNHVSLSEFWRVGTSWSFDEVTAFKDTLVRLN